MAKPATHFTLKKSVVGMIHVQALPGTPKYAGNMAAIIAAAKQEARIYADHGIDAIALENMHDTPLSQVCGRS